MGWININEKIPEDKTIKELTGTFTTKAYWDKENNLWQVNPEEKVLFEAKLWKEIENGSSKQEVSAS